LSALPEERIMPGDDRARLALYERLVELLGSGLASSVMEQLPPMPWDELAKKRDLEGLRVATKRDLEGLRVATQRDLEDLRVATKDDIAGLRAEIKRDLDQLQTEIKRDLDQLHTETKRDFDQHRADTRRDFETFEHKIMAAMRAEMSAQTRTFVRAQAGTLLTTASLAFAAARLT
jgi:hypothetical protein